MAVSYKPGNGNGHVKALSILGEDPIRNARAQEFMRDIENATSLRARIVQSAIEPDRRRNIDNECGYVANGSLTPEFYREWYDRCEYAARVVDVFPDECWKSSPEVYEDEDAEVETPFEYAWKVLCRRLRGNSFFQDEKGNPIWEILQRADKMSGIGSFGVILLGLDDGKDLREPADFDDTPSIEEYGADMKDKEGEEEEIEETERVVKNLYKTDGAGELEEENSEEEPESEIEDVEEQPEYIEPSRKLLFIRVFDQSLVQVNTWNTDTKSERYALPESYLLTLGDPRDDLSGQLGMPSTQSVQVHWTRILHIAENPMSNDLFGVPRMRPVFNRLCDIRKVLGGDAEGWWQCSSPRISFETHPQLGGDVDIDVADLQDQMEKLNNGLSKYLALSGIMVNPLAPQVSDPTAHIDIQVDAICVKLGIPKRVFMGSERGELASSQDTDTWNSRLEARCNNYLTPRVIVPFIDRCIALGVLPRPEGYSVVWPSLDKMTPVEQAAVSLQKTQAVAAYVAGGVNDVIKPMDFFTRLMGMTDEEAEQIVQTALEQDSEEDPLPTLEEREAKEQEQAKMEAEQFDKSQQGAMQMKQMDIQSRMGK